MVSFKERINKASNSTPNPNEQCAPGGRIIDYKTKLPPVTPPGPSPPGGGEGIPQELEDKLDTIIDLLAKYKGGKFSSGRLFTQAATPVELAFDITQPSPNPDIIGFYDSVDIHNNKTPPVNAEVLWIINDGPVDINDPFIYVRSSPDRQSFTQEVPIKLGEKWQLEDVYDLRVRSALLGTQYRISEYNSQLTYVSVAVGSPGVAIPANRPSFTDLNVPVNIAESTLPNIAIPDGFTLAIRSAVDNAFGSKIYTSRLAGGTAVPGTRNTLLPGDVKEYIITNANLIHVASSQNGLTLDISVEQ